MRSYAGSALMLLVTTAAAIGSYTVNLNVSAERAAVDGLRHRLVADAVAMRNLEAEHRTRARMPAMQGWNDSVLKMSAPVASQYLRSPVELASFGGTAPAPALRYAVAGPDSPAAAPPLLEAPVRRTAYVAPPVTAPSGVVRASYAPRPVPRAEAAAAEDAPLAVVPETAAPVDLLPGAEQ
jgi:hypothetical protein